MATFLDYRASINSTSVGSPNTTLSTSAASPTYIGSIGLIIESASNIRVELQGFLGLTAVTVPAGVVFIILRNPPNPTIAVGGTNIFTANHVLETTNIKTIALNAADLNATAGATTPGQITYSLFAYTTGATVTRSGPENFEGLAVTG